MREKEEEHLGEEADRGKVGPRGQTGAGWFQRNVLGSVYRMGWGVPRRESRVVQVCVWLNGGGGSRELGCGWIRWDARVRVFWLMSG